MGWGRSPYISSDVPATLEPSQRFLIQIQFSSCSLRHLPFLPPSPLFFFFLPYSSFFTYHSPLFTPLPFLTTNFSRSVLPPFPSSPLAPVSAPHISPPPPPSHPLSRGGNMKGYLCADSRGGEEGRKLINSLSGTDS